MIPSRFPRRETGLAAVEFMIVAPVLLMLLLAIAEFSNALQQYNTLTQAVREGARYGAGRAGVGSTGTAQEGEWMAAAASLTVFGNLIGSGVPRLPNLSEELVTVSLADSEHITVSATYPYQPLFAAIPTFGLREGPIVPNFVLRATVTMRAL
jgi:hypothetical protein